MKSKICVTIAILGLLFAQSCIEKVQTPEKTDNTIPSKAQDIKAPANFDWNMSAAISCTVNATTKSRVSVYQDKECANELLATFVTAQGKNTTSLSLPKTVNKIYAKYKTVSGADKIVEQLISNNAASFSISDAELFVAPRSTKADGDIPTHETPGYFDYPAGWGTVMFEDLFPGTGDYDFNDFVASYMIVVEYPWKNGAYDTQHANQIRVQLRLRALGGAKDYTPYVRVVGLNKNIASLPAFAYNDNPLYPNPKIINNTTDGVKVNLADSPYTSDVIVEFKNLNGTNPYKISGTPYYNTTRGMAIKQSQLTEVDVYIPLSEEVDVKTLLDDKIDIFIARKDKATNEIHEIHLRGFEPVFSKYDYSANGVSKTVPYASKDNLVWGIKVPMGISFLHAAENVNYCAAYKDFAAWATSGANTNKDWYKTNIVKSNLVEWAK